MGKLLKVLNWISFWKKILDDPRTQHFVTEVLKENDPST